MARPSEFTQEIADAICERIAEGESLRKICQDDAMPNKATVFRWLATNKEFSDQYAHAREEQAETLADEIVDLADKVEQQIIIDGIPMTDGEGNPVSTVTKVAVDHARLRIDARKWVAAKLKPKKYGEKSETTLKGDPESPLNVITRKIVDARTDN